MSTLKTNAVQTTAGKPILNSTGGVLQVLNVIKTDQFTTTSGTPVDVTGLNVSIIDKCLEVKAKYPKPET